MRVVIIELETKLWMELNKQQAEKIISKISILSDSRVTTSLIDQK